MNSRQAYGNQPLVAIHRVTFIYGLALSMRDILIPKQQLSSVMMNLREASLYSSTTGRLRVDQRGKRFSQRSAILNGLNFFIQKEIITS